MSGVRNSITAAFVLAVFTSAAYSQDQIWEQEGGTTVFFGAAVAMVGDLDGDGLDDVIIGDYQYSGGSGGAFVYSGSTGELVRSWVGKPGLNGLGRAVAGLGDVDGDGVSDVAVGAFWENGAPGIYVGRVYVYSGQTGAEIWSRLGEGDQDYFGQRLQALGDLNEDGARELAVTAGFHDGPAGADSGRVYVLDGATGAVLWSADGEVAGDHFGEGLGWVSDLDRDAVEDVVVGAPRHADRRGKVYVYSGATGDLLYTAEGESAGDEFGWSVAGVGDLGGDRRSEVLVGSPGYDGAAGEDSGRIVLLSGRDGEPLWGMEGAKEAILLGRAVAAAGDVNQDGQADFVVGASHSYQAATPGEAVLVSGRTFEPLWRWEGLSSGDQFGSALDAGSDLDGDSLPDVVVGAYWHSGSQGGGRVAAYLGNDLFLEATPTDPSAGETLRLHARGGLQNMKTTFFVVEIDGVSVRVPVSSGRLDRDGEWIFEAGVPSGLAGHDLRFQALAERGNRTRDSSTPLVHFR